MLSVNPAFRAKALMVKLVAFAGILEIVTGLAAEGEDEVGLLPLTV